LDAHDGTLLAHVRELVGLAGLDHHDVAGLGGHATKALLEADAPAEHLEALLLRGMHVHAGHVAVRRERDVELEQLALRVSRRLTKRDPLAADGVLDDLSSVCHFDRSSYP
jgi:hypothetical protein